MATDVSKTLAERGARYGAFIEHATIAQGLQEVLLDCKNWWRLDPDMRQMMIVICDKLARILNGDPYYTDNYHDIQGYAKLVEDRLLREQEDKKAKLFEEKEPVSERERLYEEMYHSDEQNVVEPVGGDWEAVGNYRG
jgi:hypothetical protein